MSGHDLEAHRTLYAFVESGRLDSAQVEALLSILDGVEASSTVLDQVDDPDGSPSHPHDMAFRCGVAEHAIDGYRAALATLGGLGTAETTTVIPL